MAAYNSSFTKAVLKIIKFHLYTLLILFNSPASSQTNLPDNFKIGNYVEVFGKDSIKIFFNCTGTVVDKQCASYYRVGKMDTTIINVMGDFFDYTMNNKVALKATMHNNNLEGAAHYYYNNGKVKEEGTYLNNFRQGKWTFYYPNGSIQKIYNYIDGEPIVLEAYSTNGKATVVNGNGSFKTQFSQYKQCDKFEVYGELVNGKKNGQWILSTPNAAVLLAVESFEKGIFIKSNLNNFEYTNPKIRFTNYYANEDLTLLDNSPGCPGKWILNWEYDNDNVHSSFYPELQQNLSKYANILKNQWLVIGISISRKNKIKVVNIASSINDTKLEEYIYNLLIKMTRWQTTIINQQKKDSDIFFTILVDNNQIIIPADYVYRDKIEF